MSEYAGRDRYKVLPPVAAATATVTTQPSDPPPVASVPLGPDASDADGD